jgi:hypothetical protein
VNSRGGGGRERRESEGDALDVTVHGNSDRLETMLARSWSIDRWLRDQD